MAGSSVGPSAPQFQLRLSFDPSRFPSPFASLCLSLYETRSASVKPSWQVMKLIEWTGPRPWQTSSEPQTPGRQRRGHPGLALPEPSNVVAIPAIPDRPAVAPGKIPDLIEPGGVPGLGDHLRVGQERILGDLVDHRGLDQDVPAARSRPRTEARSNRNPSTPGLGDRRPEAGEDLRPDDRVIAVDRVAAAGEVEVLPVLVQHVIKAVVEAPEVVDRAVLVPFRRVVEDDVEDDFEPRLVESGDRPPEFLAGGPPLPVAGVGRLDRREGDRVVPPEVAMLLAGQGVDERASFSSNSSIGSSSTAVIPRSLRYASFSASPANVPGWRTPEDGSQVKPRTCIS